jgi:branched-chain amino acid transport system ATP-binding protein
MRREEGGPVLEARNIHVYYRKIAALKGISFKIHRGEIVSMLGANGAGKTTTLNAISGIIPLKSGEILLRGKSIRGEAPHGITRKGIVHAPEGRHIFPDLSVQENLKVAGYLYRGKDRRIFNDRLELVFTLFPLLKTRYGQPGGTLSGGEQQMLAIGRALVTGGDILLLDEPSMGLAPNLVKEIFEVIRRISETGQTIMLVEQNAAMAMEISDYCYVLETGKLLFEGEPATLAANHDIASAYLG